MWLKMLFSNKNRKMAIAMLHSLNKKIDSITLKEDKKKIDQDRKDLNNKLDTVSINKVIAEIEALNSKVDNYIRIQNDKNYSALIEHLSKKNIESEEEIMEICNISDRNIVFKYVQARKKEGGNDNKKIIQELELVKQILERIKTVVSEEDDAEELRRNWNNIINDQLDKLAGLKDKVNNLNINELDVIKDTISYFSKRSNELEKYGNNYLSKDALKELTEKIKENMPSTNIKLEDIYNDGLGDGIITELKEYTGLENQGKRIKGFIAKIIYERLRKGLYLR